MRSAGMPLRHLSESTVRWEAKYRRVQEVLLPRCPLERVVITTTMQRRATPRHRRCSAREPAEVHMIRKLKSGQYRLHSRKADLRTGEYVLRDGMAARSETFRLHVKLDGGAQQRR
jgi:hypothetical protein